jgi:hypothetical protein
VIAESMNCSQFGSHTEKQIAIVMSVTTTRHSHHAHVMRFSKVHGVALSALL